MGTALLDYQNGGHGEDILTYSSLAGEDVIPLAYLFRNFDQMPSLEQKALEQCRGSVLDIGCGAGSHSLYLQGKGHEVVGLDSSAGAIAVCRSRGLKNTLTTDINMYSGKRFDTLLMLMNGIGLVGKVHRLEAFLDHLKLLLKPNGQILLDSSDIIYMFEEDGDVPPRNDTYYGEVEFTLAYKGKKGKPFFWLYLDFSTLQESAWTQNLECELVSQGKHYDYLARLRPVEY